MPRPRLRRLGRGAPHHGARGLSDDAFDGFFRRESAHLTSALTRLFGPSNLALVEDVVQDALMSAMQAWRFGLPKDPRAWVLQVAKNRALDVLRRDKRSVGLEPKAEDALVTALSPEEDGPNQLAMMFALCDEGLSPETHVTLILRWLCGLSPPEIARAFLVDTQTIDRRLHRGRTRMQELGRLIDVTAEHDVLARQPSVEQALYLLFNEGYHGSDAENPLHPALCADALRLVGLLLDSRQTRHETAHALAALFCFNAARLDTRLDAEGVLLPLAEQDRTKWNRGLIEQGVLHLSQAASGTELTRWHLEAGIAAAHTLAQSVKTTDWAQIVGLYDALTAVDSGPVVALNRGLALAELEGLNAGRTALKSLESDPRMAAYSFYWAARADLERRAGRWAEAESLYARAIALAKSPAERKSYERRVAALGRVRN